METDDRKKEKTILLLLMKTPDDKGEIDQNKKVSVRW